MGATLPGVVLDARSEWVEVQIADPPVRTRIPRGGDGEIALGARVRLKVSAWVVEGGRVELELHPPAG